MNPTYLLFLSLGLLLAGHGLQLSLLPLFAAEAGFDQETIGLTGSLYFLGFITGCITATTLLKQAGAIRVLMTLMSVMAGVLLALEALPVFWVWMLLRFATGWAIAAVYTTVEGWLAEGSSPGELGKQFSIYVVVTLVGIAAGQTLLGILPEENLFTAGALMMLIAIIPLGLFCPEQTLNLVPLKLNPQKIREIPLIATLGVTLTGVVTGCIWTMAPLMGESRGFSYTDVALMMNAMVLGGVLLQIPFGTLSDRWHRPATVMLACAIGGATSAIGFMMQDLHQLAFLLLMFCYGGCALSLYGICASAGHAATNLSRIETSSILLLVHGLGCVAGPIFASIAALFTTQNVFLVSLISFAALAGVSLIRQPARKAEVCILNVEPRNACEQLSEVA